MKKIFITGSNGLLGSDLVNIVSAPSFNCQVLHSTRHDLDITDRAATIDHIKRIRPFCVIHSAAYTKVDDCEKERDTAFNVNGEGTGNVATACREVGALMVYISTDYVYDGKKQTPFKEDDKPCPINVYGESKLMGERYVQDILENYLIVRASWLYGRSGPNFVKSILKAVKSRNRLEVVNDQTGSPTFTRDLSSGIYNLLRVNATGIINLSNSGSCTWFEFAKKILELSDIRGVEVVPVTTEKIKRPAKRPRYSVLNCSRYESVTGKKMRRWDKAVREYIDNFVTVHGCQGSGIRG